MKSPHSSSANESPGESNDQPPKSLSLPIVDCDNCGACCLTVGHPQFFWGPIGTVDPHWDGVPNPLKIELETYIDELKEIDIGQPCIWFDAKNRRCQHYDHRPQMCRDFEVGTPTCRRLRLEHGVDSGS